MGRKAKEKPVITEKDLGHWQILRRFRKALEEVFGSAALGRSWTDPKRKLEALDYLSLFLFGLINPVTQTLRGIAQASEFERVQEEVCGHRVPRSTFSDAQNELDPAYLETLFNKLAASLPTSQLETRDSQWQWLAQDGSLFRALPRMAWAIHGAGKAGHPNRAARLHLTLNVIDDTPVKAALRPGGQCERAVWEEKLNPGEGYIADRYYGESYQLFGRLEQKGCAFVIRLRNQAVINVEEELPLSQADHAAGVSRQAWVTLGERPSKRSMRLRLVWVPLQGDELILATNLGLEELPAELVAELYRKRWKVEMFFKWIKCILKCGHWIAESQRGATIQIYLALIASLYFQLFTGRRPSKRVMEAFQFYHMGLASEKDMRRVLENYKNEFKRRK